MAVKKSQKPVKKQRKIHPNSLANLQPFTGGPDPRRNTSGPVPQDQRELNELLDEIFAEDAVNRETGEKMQKLRLGINKLIASKNIAGVMYLLDRRYGRVAQKIEGDPDNPIKILVEYANGNDD
jgi:hypothetical protein